MPLVKCKHCNKNFHVQPYKLKCGKGKYCSKQCHYTHKYTTHKLWNKHWLEKESEIKPMKQIAKELHCNIVTIQKWRNKFNIHPRLGVSYYPGWKSNRLKMKEGYIKVHINKHNPYYKMADRSGHILEHRLIMAQHLGKCLESWEIIHHKNRKRDDNRIENLELLSSQGDHLSILLLQREVKKLRERVTLLEMENQLLKESVG